MENNTKQISKLIYIAWIATTLFFMYQYILRIAPGVLVDEIRQEFKMTAEQFSLLGSLFYYSYALLQIPVGLIIDRIGIKTTVFFSLLLCIIGGTILASTGDILLAYVSRILIGAGASTSFMSALKITADYFPEGKRGILIGATLTMGTIGAIGAGKPFVNLVEHYGWRTALFYTTISGIIIIFLCLITIPRKSKDFDKNNLDQEPLWQSIVTVLKNKKIIVYSLLAVSLYAPVVVIADLWGTAFIMTKYQISRADAANGSVAIYIGMAIGSLILPALCERKNIINSSIKICNILIFITFSFLLFGPNLNFISLFILLFIMGFICGSEMVIPELFLLV